MAWPDDLPPEIQARLTEGDTSGWVGLAGAAGAPSGIISAFAPQAQQASRDMASRIRADGGINVALEAERRRQAELQRAVDAKAAEIRASQDEMRTAIEARKAEMAAKAKENIIKLLPFQGAAVTPTPQQQFKYRSPKEVSGLIDETMARTGKLDTQKFVAGMLKGTGLEPTAEDIARTPAARMAAGEGSEMFKGLTASIGVPPAVAEAVSRPPTPDEVKGVQDYLAEFAPVTELVTSIMDTGSIDAAVAKLQQLSPEQATDLAERTDAFITQLTADLTRIEEIEQSMKEVFARGMGKKLITLLAKDERGVHNPQDRQFIDTLVRKGYETYGDIFNLNPQHEPSPLSLGSHGLSANSVANLSRIDPEFRSMVEAARFLGLEPHPERNALAETVGIVQQGVNDFFHILDEAGGVSALAGHLLRASARLGIEATSVLLNVGKGTIGMAVSGAQMLSASITGNAEAYENAREDLRTRAEQTRKALYEPVFNVPKEFGWAEGREGKYDVLSAPRKAGGFEFFPNSIPLNIASEILLDPLNLVSGSFVGSVWDDVMRNSLPRRITLALDDIVDIARGAGSIGSKLSEIKKIVKESGVVTHFVNLARKADAAGDVVDFVKPTARTLAGLTDDALLPQVYSKLRLPSREFDSFRDAYISIKRLATAAEREQSFGRLLTSLAANGRLPDSLKGVLKAELRHPALRQAALSVRDKPVIRTFYRWGSRTPMDVLRSAGEVEFFDTLRAYAQGAHFTPAMTDEIIRRAVNMDVFERVDYFDVVQAIAKGGKSAENIVVSGRNAEHLVGLIADVSLNKRFAEATKPLVNAYKANYGRMSDAIDDLFSQIQVSAMTAANAGNTSTAYAIAEFSDQLLDRIKSARNFGISDAEAIAKMLRKNQALLGLADDSVDAFAGGVAALRRDFDAMKAGVREAAAAEKIESPIISNIMNLGRGVQKRDVINDKEIFAGIINNGKIESIVNPAGNARPVTAAQLGWMVQFDDGVLEAVRKPSYVSTMFSPKYWPHFPAMVLADMRNIADKITGIMKKIWIGKATYVVRSWTTNKLKLFLNGFINPKKVKYFDELMDTGAMVVDGQKVAILTPSALDDLERGLDASVTMPYRFRQGRTQHFSGVLASEDPERAVRQAVRLYLDDEVVQAYIKGGPKAAAAAIKSSVHGEYLASMWGGSDEMIEGIGKLIANMDEHAPKTFAAMKQFARIEDADKAPTVNDIVKILKRNNEDFVVPLPEVIRHRTDFVPPGKLGKKINSMVEENYGLYRTVFGAGIRHSRQTGYKTVVVDYLEQLVRAGISADEAAAIAADMAVKTVNELLMDFSKTLIYERDFEWLMPFASDLRLETLNYLKMARRNPKVLRFLTSTVKDFKQAQEEKGYPSWAAFSWPVPLPGGKTFYLNIPSFVLYPELGSMPGVQDEATPMSMLTEQFSPLPLAALRGLDKAPLLSGLKDVPGIKQLRQAALETPWQGFTQYESIYNKAQLRSNINNLLNQYYAESYVPVGLSPQEYVLNSLGAGSAISSGDARRQIQNRIDRKIAAGEKAGKKIDEAFIRRAFDEAVSEYAPSNSLYAVLRSQFVPSGSIYTPAEMEIMGESEDYYNAANRGDWDTANKILREKPYLEWSVKKPGEPESGLRKTPFERLRDEEERKPWYQGPDAETLAAKSAAEYMRVGVPELGAMFTMPPSTTNVDSLQRMYEKADYRAKLAASGGMEGMGESANAALTAATLAAMGYDAEGNPTEVLNLWRAWELGNAADRSVSGPKKAWQKYLEERFLEGLIPDEATLKRYEAFNPYRFSENKADAMLKAARKPWSMEEASARLAAQPLTERLSSAPPLRLPGSEVQTWGDWRYQGELAQLHDRWWTVKTKEIPYWRSIAGEKPGTLAAMGISKAMANAKVDELTAEAAALEQAMKGLPIPEVAGLTYPAAQFGTTEMQLAMRLGGVDPRVLPPYSAPVPVTTSQIRDEALSRLSPDEAALAGTPLTPSEEQYAKKTPEERAAYVEGMSKLTTQNTWGANSIILDLSDPEQLKLAEGITGWSEQKLRRANGKSGMGNPIFYEGKVYFQSFPMNWLDQPTQDLLRRNMDPGLLDDIVNAKSGGGGKGGKRGYGYRRKGGWGYKDWGKGQRAFSKGVPGPLDIYFSLPKSERAAYIKAHPEIKDAFRARKSGESDEDYKYRLKMLDLSDRLYELPTSQLRHTFLENHPELVAWFEAKRDNKDKYYMQAMARAFVANPELWEEYLQKQTELIDYMVAEKTRWPMPGKSPKVTRR